MTQKSSKYIWETSLILIFVIVAIRIVYDFRTVSWFGNYVPLVVAAILIYVPAVHGSIKKERMTYLDRSLKDFSRSLRWFLITAILIMPPFLLGNHFWQEIVFQKSFMPRMIPTVWLTIISQLFLVAIPEELFFRGWFQTRLNNLFRPRWNILGIKLGWSWILTAAIFAIAHSVIFYQWWHFAIFFSALLFGWLREKTGTIAAPSLWHCLGNVAMVWIGGSYV